MRKFLVCLAVLVIAATVSSAAVLSLNLPGGSKLDVVCENLQATGYLDICNWRELSGLETTILRYGKIDINLAGIFTAPDKASAGLDLNYSFDTKNVLITKVNFGIWGGNDVYIQNGRVINMYGVKIDIPLSNN